MWTQASTYIVEISQKMELKLPLHILHSSRIIAVQDALLILQNKYTHIKDIFCSYTQNEKSNKNENCK